MWGPRVGGVQGTFRGRCSGGHRILGLRLRGEARTGTEREAEAAGVDEMAAGEVRSVGRGKILAIINIQGFKCLKEDGVGTKLGTGRKSRFGGKPTAYGQRAGE